MKRLIALIFLLYTIPFSFIFAQQNPNLLPNRPKIGLVLSGGGAKGIAHVGALKVIEELGIPIDYIGGTSMGSIVGGLYALGYSAPQLEQYMLEINWSDLFFGSSVPRRTVALYEKGEKSKYSLRLSLEKGKLVLPVGLLGGHNVFNLFTELSSSDYDRTDFRRFPIPFFCIAADIDSGEEVLIEQGNLPKAMRASMAIPSVFSPEIINGTQLYDGGIINNFPVDRMKEKGVDIIIGIDVGTETDAAYGITAYDVLDKVMFMNSRVMKKENKNLCDILIEPNVSDYSAASFNSADSLIKRGEEAARNKYNDLFQLAQKLSTYKDYPRKHRACPMPLSDIYITEIQVDGLKKISRDFVLRLLDLAPPTFTTFEDLNAGVLRLEGSQMLESIRYHLYRRDDGIGLYIECKEAYEASIKVGLHYDNEYSLGLLAGFSTRNLLLNNSRLNIEGSLGEKPFVQLSYMQSPRLKPSLSKFWRTILAPDWRIYGNIYTIDAYAYDGSTRAASYAVNSYELGLDLNFALGLHNLIGIGTTLDNTHITTKVGERSYNLQSWYSTLDGKAFYEHDSYNRDFFPTHGAKLKLLAETTRPIAESSDSLSGSFGLQLRSNFAISPTSRWTMHLGMDAGLFLIGNPLQHYRIYLGGMSNYHWRNEISVPGLYFLQKVGNSAYALHWNHQVRLWSHIYILGQFYVSNVSDSLQTLLTDRNQTFSTNLSLQYNSMFGPIGASCAFSNQIKGAIIAFNLGYWL